MALRYYDDIIAAKIKKWIPDNSSLHVLKPDESRRLFELKADEDRDAALKLPFVALSRGKDVELLSNIKNLRSFNGLAVAKDKKQTIELNVIPVKLEYQLDIYTATYEEGDEYLRNFLFKLINNPKIVIDIPYQGLWLRHTANIRVLDNVSDTSDISEKLFADQFTRWTINLELQDAFLFSVPYKKNWRLWVDEEDYMYASSELEIYDKEGYVDLVESEKIPFGWVKD